MRNFMCIFLIVLLNQRALHGLRCYQSEAEGPCLDEYLRNREPGFHEKALSCLKKLKEKDMESTPSMDTCIKVIFTYVDNDTLAFTDCDDSQDDFPRCEKLMNVIDGVANKKLKHKFCEKCKANMCNPKTKKVETTTNLSKQNTSQNTKPPSKEANKSIEILPPNIAVLIFVVLISLKL